MQPQAMPEELLLVASAMPKEACKAVACVIANSGRPSYMYVRNFPPPPPKKKAYSESRPVYSQSLHGSFSLLKFPSQVSVDAKP